MAKEICISSTPHETRLAILEDDQLAEIYYERENEYTLAGSIYNGRVTRVLPGMQSAFVDVGLERDAFLYVTDFLELEDQEETDELEKAAASGPNQPPREVRHGGDRTGNGTAANRPEAGPRRAGPRGRATADPAEKRATEPAGRSSVRASESLVISEQPEDGAGILRTKPEPSAGADAAAVAAAAADRPKRPEAPAGDGRSRPEPATIEAAAEPGTAGHPARFERAALAAPRVPSRAPAPFVLPGESLSRVWRRTR